MTSKQRDNRFLWPEPHKSDITVKDNVIYIKYKFEGSDAGKVQGKVAAAQYKIKNLKKGTYKVKAEIHIWGFGLSGYTNEVSESYEVTHKFE